jgi:dTDP-glucose 4,6-dehydratase
MISKALADESLPVYGNGLNVRDWLFVDDHCRAIDLIIHGGRPGEIYNVGGHNERQNIQVVKTVLDRLGKPYDLISYVTDRAGHDLRYAIDPAKIHAELGWEPLVKFETGIGETIDWYVNNRGWTDDILSGAYAEYNRIKGEQYA